MTALQAWVSTDSPPRLAIVRSNTWTALLPAQDEWDPTFEKLQAWLADPTALADDDVDPPAPETIRLAIAIAGQRRARARPAPTRLMPNGEAGIVFEWSAGNSTSTWEIDRRHQLEITFYVEGERTTRERFDLTGLSLT
ncbi:MAG: hypothetical protein FJ265_08140 [Planctomycetes bacterium]|nr:hypothetical protein [Planctomycetota bacterium]